MTFEYVRHGEKSQLYFDINVDALVRSLFFTRRQKGTKKGIDRG